MSLRPALTAGLAALASISTSAHAHDGHGLLGGHWHATDAWGFVGVAALVALAIWLSRGD